MIKLAWPEFKAIIEKKTDSVQFAEYPDRYRLWHSVGGLSFTCDILKETNESLEFELSYKPSGNLGMSSTNTPFSAKKLGSKSLFKRVHGVNSEVQVGSNTLEFINPYAQCKITGVEVIGASSGDTCDFEVWFGTMKLNQFGFNVFLAKDFYSHHSEYDSDIPQGLKVKVIYNSISVKTVGINLILNELK